MLGLLLVLGIGDAACLQANDVSYQISIFLTTRHLNRRFYGVVQQNQCQALNFGTYVLRLLVLIGAIAGMNFNAAQLRAILMQSPWMPSLPIQVQEVSA
jgi:Asp/Glu/hydantoin racemase